MDDDPLSLVHVSETALLAYLVTSAQREKDFAVPEEGPGLAQWVARYDHNSVLDMVLSTGSASLVELVLEGSTNPRGHRLLDIAAQHGSLNVMRSLTKSPIGREKVPRLLQLRNQWGETALHILAALPHIASIDIMRLLKECCSDGEWATVEQLEDNWKRSAYTVATECSNRLVLDSGLLSPQQAQNNTVEEGRGDGEVPLVQGTGARIQLITSEFLEAQRRFQQRRAEAETKAEKVVEKGIFAPAPAPPAAAAPTPPSAKEASLRRAGPPLPSLFEYPLDRARLSDALRSADEEGLLSRDMFGNTLLHKVLHWGDAEAAALILSRAAGCGGAALQRLLQARGGDGLTPGEIAQSLGPNALPPSLCSALQGGQREREETSKMLAALDLPGLWERLGHPFCVSGTVVHGEKRGRQLGYPTANLGEMDQDQAPMPPAGVYAGWLQRSCDGAVYSAAISVGDSPTFEGERAVSVEAFCLIPGQEGGHQGPTDPSSAAWIDLYGLKVTVFFGFFLRGMVKYEGATWLKELLAQMEKDCLETRRLTGGRGPHDARVMEGN